MVMIARSRFWRVLLLLTAIMLGHPPGARAERIDIDDPALLGPRPAEHRPQRRWWHVRL